MKQELMQYVKDVYDRKSRWFMKEQTYKQKLLILDELIKIYKRKESDFLYCSPYICDNFGTIAYEEMKKSIARVNMLYLFPELHIAITKRISKQVGMDFVFEVINGRFNPGKLTDRKYRLNFLTQFRKGFIK